MKRLLSHALVALALLTNVSAMAARDTTQEAKATTQENPTTIILVIRHAEKPDSAQDPGLSPAGELHAQNYVKYFENYTVNGKKIQLDALFRLPG